MCSCVSISRQNKTLIQISPKVTSMYVYLEDNEGWCIFKVEMCFNHFLYQKTQRNRTIKLFVLIRFIRSHLSRYIQQ